MPKADLTIVLAMLLVPLLASLLLTHTAISETMLPQSPISCEIPVISVTSARDSCPG